MKTPSFLKLFSLVVLGAVLLAACSPAAAPVPAATTAPTAAAGEPVHLILATTTSTQDSGLLDYLLPDFEKENNVKVDVIAVGSGQALQTGKDGNADVLLVHSPAAEKTFMDDGDGVRREDVMYNDFVIVGPESDPAKISGMTSATEAFKAIAAAQAAFVSRGDDSGTHSKEKAIWKSAEIEPQGDWYISAGQGMGAVLTMADEKQAYTLSDRATYLAMTKEELGSKLLVEGDKALFNPYGVIAVDPAISPKINNALANQFIDWLTSLPVQEKISQYGVEEFGQSLFTPSATAWKEAHP
jgi:tungstate transport system substrate-binding protein